MSYFMSLAACCVFIYTLHLSTSLPFLKNQQARTECLFLLSFYLITTCCYWRVPSITVSVVYQIERDGQTVGNNKVHDASL
jgi:hypothetical protein